MTTKFLPALNRQAVNPNDKYLVAYYVDENTWQTVESQPTQERAFKAVSILTEHEPTKTWCSFRTILKGEIEGIPSEIIDYYIQEGELDSVHFIQRREYINCVEYFVYFAEGCSLDRWSFVDGQWKCWFR